MLWVEVLESKYRGWRGLLNRDSSSSSSLWWIDLKLSCGGGALIGGLIEILGRR